MKVLMTADTLGGVWDYSLELCRGLQFYGAEVVLATLGRPLTEAQRTALAQLTHVTVQESQFKLCWMADPWDDVERAGDWLLGLAERTRPDVIHLNDYAHGALAWPAPVLMVGHSCVASWWEAVHGTALPPQWRRYQREVQRGLQAADLVVAPTCVMLEALQRHYGTLPYCRVIANGRSGLTPATKLPLVLAAGRLWDKAKNIATLAQAAPGLPWPVCIAGEDEHPDGGKVEFPNVHLLGQLAPPILAWWMSKAAIYALPARYEPFGLSILEAALAGCVLVLGDIPSLREVWGEAALYVPPDDPKRLGLQLHALINDSTLRTRYACRAQLHAQLYTPQTMVQAYRNVYGELQRAGLQRCAADNLGVRDANLTVELWN
jgi:glycosyltransferase involved in cell wall biosynthesis